MSAPLALGMPSALAPCPFFQYLVKYPSPIIVPYKLSKTMSASPLPELLVRFSSALIHWQLFGLIEHFDLVEHSYSLVCYTLSCMEAWRR